MIGHKKLLGQLAESDTLRKDNPYMGCCQSADEQDVQPMPAGQVVGLQQGSQVTREEARERAAAAAESRAQAAATRGQQGPTSKIKKGNDEVRGNTGKPNMADPLVWD